MLKNVWFFRPPDALVFSSSRPLSPEVAMLNQTPNKYLGGGFKHFLCSSLFGEDSHFD